MLKYNGNGFLAGIPARDLTDDEVKQFGEKELLATGLYSKEEEKPVQETEKKEVKHGRNKGTKETSMGS
jgi:hypothetical protein